LNIQKHLMSKGLGVLVLARIDQIAVAGAIFFCGKQAIYKFGASDASRQQARGNNLVMWEGIRWLAAQGCEQLDFGRTSVNDDGLRRFKAGWGTRERIVEYLKYDIPRALFMVDKDRASGWHNQIFSRMPIALLRVAGSVLYRQMT
jgi:lipid II:glycine glycyltransferase (peptidoglycan interpeptide bridge formation enzyme)